MITSLTLLYSVNNFSNLNVSSSVMDTNIFHIRFFFLYSLLVVAHVTSFEYYFPTHISLFPKKEKKKKKKKKKKRVRVTEVGIFIIF